jgi:hypothetical protein
MAAPTIADLAIEGLKKAGIKNPDNAAHADIYNRATTDWPEEIKDDIWLHVKTPELFQAEQVQMLTKGVSKYSNPTDFGGHIDMKLLWGTNSGTSQAVAAATITLSASETVSDDFIIGKEILITNGAAAGQISECTAYNESTKIATVTTWGTTPTGTPTYLIVDVEYEVTEHPIYELTNESYPMTLNRPAYYLPKGDADDFEFNLFPNPDEAYGLRQRYYILPFDVATTRLSTAYTRWRNLFVYGIRWKAFQDRDDDRAEKAETQYFNYLKMVAAKGNYGMNMSNLQQTCDD